MHKSLHILSIDDDYIYQKISARFLTFSGGHKVDVAYTGTEGIKKAAELKPDMILLDMRMPDMSGTQVLDALCNGVSTREIPVIMLTGAVLDDNEKNVLLRRNNFRFLETKPVSFAYLLTKIATLLTDEQPAADAGRPSPLNEDLSGTGGESCAY